MEFRNFLFRCPKTGLMVQGSTGKAAPEAQEVNLYTGVYCNACGGWHLVNPQTGKLVSDETKVR